MDGNFGERYLRVSGNQDDFELPGSDDIEIRAEVVKRERAGTVSVAEPKGKKRKT